jgi:hypothetical protein
VKRNFTDALFSKVRTTGNNNNNYYYNINIVQEVAGDWNELHNEELRSELVLTKYHPMKFRGIGLAGM